MRIWGVAATVAVGVLLGSVAVAAGATQVRAPLGIVASTASQSGIHVSAVNPGSPSETAGLRTGDVVVGLGVHHLTSLTELQRGVDQHQGDLFPLKVRRDGNVIEIMVPRDPADARFRALRRANRRCASFCLVEESQRWSECGCVIAECKFCNGCAL